MRDALVVTVLSMLPRKRMSRGMGSAARTTLSALGVRAFVRAYGVNLDEAEHPVSAYPTLDAFFVRRLRPGARPIDPAPDALVSPVDGTVAWAGTTSGGMVEVAPGRAMSAAALLGRPTGEEYDAAVLYLSPKDYHRVHVPREGVLTGWRYLAGTLWPVFPAAVRRVDGLFERNERAALTFETSNGPLHVVFVGAFGVGRIEVPAVGLGLDVVPQASEGAVLVPMARGDDLGAFHLGSTVVLLAPAGSWTWTVKAGETVRVGRAIASATA